MKRIEPPLSIRIIYWLTNFSLFVLFLTSLATLAFNILIHTDFFGNDLQLHVQFPAKVDFLETGKLFLNGQELRVELVEASAKIHIFNTPGFIAEKIGLALIFVTLFSTYLIWIFRKFIKNVKNGDVFSIENIFILKKLAYGLVAFWLFTTIYMRISYYYIAGHLEFENVQITNDIPNYSGILFVALFIWVIAHIFITGLKLQQERELTI